MSRICASCGKRPQVANNVSHANNKVKKWVYPNVHRMHFVFTNDASGKVHRGNICTKCLRGTSIRKIV
ncbi:TPA: 50S ribosomal protein L28 [Candidatus Dependentiae bacterium]|nr:50S ribosomal protein L28 [Candidatus Dependentiae bacterium]